MYLLNNNILSTCNFCKEQSPSWGNSRNPASAKIKVSNFVSLKKKSSSSLFNVLTPIIERERSFGTPSKRPAER